MTSDFSIEPSPDARGVDGFCAFGAIRSALGCDIGGLGLGAALRGLSAGSGISAPVRKNEFQGEGLLSAGGFPPVPGIRAGRDDAADELVRILGKLMK